MRLRERWRLCKLAGIPKPFEVAQKSFHELSEPERALIAIAVRTNLMDLPDSTWGLADG